VPANNPFNLCNPNGVPGLTTDCGLAADALTDTVTADPNFIAQVDDYYGVGAWNYWHSQGFLYLGPQGADRFRPVVAVDGDRSDVDVKVAQTRFVTGIRGDLPSLTYGEMS